MANISKGIHQLYNDDPVKADEYVFGRTSDPVSRRGFLTGLATMSAVLGGEVVFGKQMPAGLIPASLAFTDEPFKIPGKNSGLTVLNDRPINAETPAHLLDDKITPGEMLFVRNNGHPPHQIDAQSWTLTVGGESAQQSKTYTINQLKERFQSHSLQITLECGGNGRAEFDPPARGNQWTTGAVGCPRWTGVRLADVLEDCGIKEDAVYLAFVGADTHLSGDPEKLPISRGVPVQKALEPESLIAWGLNGEDLPLMNGYPLRLVIGGYPGSVSGKWLKQLLIRDRVHDGPKMTGKSYRVPSNPVEPGAKVPDKQFVIIENMPVKSLVTYPKSGILHPQDQKLEVRGHAWAGHDEVSALDVSIDFGQTWQQAELTKPVNRYAWQHFKTKVSFPKKGYYEIWARATNSKNRMQPMVIPGWNPKGYLNNACHRIGVRAV